MINYLKEEFVFKGTDAKEFFSLCKDMDANTSYIRATSPELSSFKGESENGLSYTGIEVSFPVMEQELGDINEADGLYTELLHSRAPVITLENGNSFLATNKAIAEIAALRGLHGSPINIASPARDAYVNELARKLKVTLVCRKVNGLRRIMSTRSDKFGPIPMKTIEDVYNGFMSSDWIGSYKVANWYMTQDEGAIYIEFPDLAANMKAAYPNVPDDWVPGVIFKNGTTGYCTLNATMTYHKEGSDVLFEVGHIAAKHYIGFSPDDFIKRMQNECWGLYTRMPEALEKMTQVNVASDEVEALLEKIYKFIKLNKVFQKKDTETCRYLESIRKRALTDCNCLTNPTLYDIVNVIMNIPENVTVPMAYQKLLKDACGRAWQYEM